MTEHDDGCGPMAAAFLRDYSPKWEVVSAGRSPATAFPSLLVEVMRECLIDMRDYVPSAVTGEEMSAFDAVYECPDLSCPDTLDACRDLRDYIKNESFKYYKKSR